MVSQKVKVIKKIFVSEESGFGVFKVSVKGERENQIIVGNLFDVNEGDFLEIEGEHTRHARFGQQIKVHNFKFILPQDSEGMIRYLSSGRIKGVGKKTAERIVERFGHSTFEILENEPDRLKEIKGIKKDVIEEIKKSIHANRTIRELTVKLSPYAIGSETIFKIHKEFGDDAFKILETNPYLTINRIRGIGFKIADTAARAFGLPLNDPNRITAGIDFLLDQFEQKNGDLYVDEHVLLDRGAPLLSVEIENIRKSIETKIERNELVRELVPGEGHVLLSYKNFILEKAIARKLYKIDRGGSRGQPLTVDFRHISRKLSVALTEEQQNAVLQAVNTPLTIITGGPGTGKTTIIRAIIEAFHKHQKEVLIAAPTGRAAKRIEETSHFSASTIHRMLKINPETRTFVHNENNPLPVDVVVVDEASMVDSFIFYSLLKAIAQHTQLIIIGDKDQLPSVGPGNVLRDMIHSDYFNTIHLNRNFRQTENSLIIENAYRINSGEPIITKAYSPDLDFVFIPVANEGQALKKVMGILDYHKNDLPFNSPDLQILVPMYRGEAGIDNLNRLIQERLNSEGFLIRKEKVAFKRMDKVMQLKNNYEKMIFNGEQGIVAAFDEENKLLSIDFDGYFVEYHSQEMDELTVSYAVSVHKSQGSEYDTVILVLLPAHSIMLNREIFYTAVTRAKRKIYLISDDNTVQRAIANSSPSERKTLLPLRLRQTFEPQVLKLEPPP